jgi:hypothetical protein
MAVGLLLMLLLVLFLWRSTSGTGWSSGSFLSRFQQEIFGTTTGRPQKSRTHDRTA